VFMAPEMTPATTKTIPYQTLRSIGRHHDHGKYIAKTSD
jgi:hypothetical protein